MEEDDRVSLKPLKPTQALKALLSVNIADHERAPKQCSERAQGKRCARQAGHLGPHSY